jgi:prolyl oligopeptidase
MNTSFRRRHFLARSAGALATTLMPHRLLAATNSPKIPPAPVARVEIVRDTYFGDLCTRKYTSPKHLAIGGRSAGGIAVGRAMTERPDLFGAVVAGVGWSNPLRYVVEPNGFGEEPEWGAISDPQGYRALRSIDSYQSVKNDTRYPAVLLTTGVTDPRVAPFHVAKMAARLQAAKSSGKPILLRVDFDAGHGVGSTREQQDKKAADSYAFLLWQVGSERS